MITSIETVLEAAEIRVDQWRGVADGQSPMDLVDELYEIEADEARNIAEEQAAAIKAVRASLPAKATRTDLDVLANNAMCIWEHVLHCQRAWKTHYDRIEDEPLHAWLADGQGAFSARDGCWALAGWAEWAWDQFTDEKQERPGGYEAFDWDFIPVFIDELFHVCSDRNISPSQVDEGYVLMALAAIRFLR